MAVQTNEDVAAKVRGAAAERRVSQAKLADALGLSRMAMSRRMAGATPFAPQELIDLGVVLATPVATFFGEPSTPDSTSSPIDVDAAASPQSRDAAAPLTAGGAQ